MEGRDRIEEADDEIIRICGKLADALIPVLEKELSSFLTSCEPRVKKRMYEALYDLPRACPLSSFLERSGIARSTFYGVLKNGHYGHALEKQREKDRTRPIRYAGSSIMTDIKKERDVYP